MEDDPASGKFLTFNLSSLNIEYIEAMSGERALKLMENEEVDGMLLDIALGAGISRGDTDGEIQVNGTF